MKVTVNVDCTPEEARAFLGLPNVEPLNAALVNQMQARISIWGSGARSFSKPDANGRAERFWRQVG